ncbi:DUF86 domain-containing protein [bacterium]|nr:DUF86 domain-containing protein [bacterium]MBU1024813.1 DUF86 domain-containing protein [bacterium]
MRPDNRDSGLLWDMHNAACEIKELTEGLSYSQFGSQKALRYAVERLLMIIREAAKRVSDDFKTSHQEIPWKAIIGQRNVLAHEYGEIILDRIWSVIVDRIPELLNQLEPYIQLENDEE